jgi:hypothetical protein
MSSINNKYAALDSAALQGQIKTATKGMKRGTTVDLAECLKLKELGYEVQITKPRGFAFFGMGKPSYDLLKNGQTVGKATFRSSKPERAAKFIQSAIIKDQWNNKDNLSLQDQAQLLTAMGNHATRDLYYRQKADGREERVKGNPSKILDKTKSVKNRQTGRHEKVMVEGGEKVRETNRIGDFSKECIGILRNDTLSITERADALLALNRVANQLSSTARISLDSVDTDVNLVATCAVNDPWKQ